MSDVIPILQIEQDEEGNAYIPLPPSDNYPIRQIVPADPPAVGWLLVGFTGWESEVIAWDPTLQELLRIAEKASHSYF